MMQHDVYPIRRTQGSECKLNLWGAKIMSNNGKRYDKEFKADIVRLVREEKRSVGSIVTDFGITQQTVRKWTGESKMRDNPDKVIIAELPEQIQAKDKKLADHELTIDILKKATAIFAKDNRKSVSYTHLTLPTKRIV